MQMCTARASAHALERLHQVGGGHGGALHAAVDSQATSTRGSLAAPRAATWALDGARGGREGERARARGRPGATWTQRSSTPAARAVRAAPATSSAPLGWVDGEEQRDAGGRAAPPGRARELSGPRCRKGRIGWAARRTCRTPGAAGERPRSRGEVARKSTLRAGSGLCTGGPHGEAVAAAGDGGEVERRVRRTDADGRGAGHAQGVGFGAGRA